MEDPSSDRDQLPPGPGATGHADHERDSKTEAGGQGLREAVVGVPERRAGEQADRPLTMAQTADRVVSVGMTERALLKPVTSSNVPSVAPSPVHGRT